MKLVVITDVHGNLPALQIVLETIQCQGYDALFHLGDVIGIGPYPAECLDLLLSLSNIRFVMGNHDAWFAHGLPNPQPTWMSDGEVRHQKWIHNQISPHLQPIVAAWPYLIQDEFEEVSITCLHYGLKPSGNDFVPILQETSALALDNLFSQYDTNLVFYGHHHPFSDVRGLARYINPGSLGCYSEPIARYTTVSCYQGKFTINHYRVPYNDRRLFDAFEERQVPEREFLYAAFYGSRFT